MTVFKYFLKMVWRKKLVLLIYLILTIILNLNIGRGLSQKNSLENIRVDGYIVDKDDTEISRNLVDELKKYTNITEGVTEENRDQLIYQGTISYYAEIPEGFGEKFKEGMKVKFVQDPKYVDTYLISQKINQYLTFLTATDDGNGGYDFGKVKDALDQEVTVTLLNKGSHGSTRYRIQMFNLLSYTTLAVFVYTLGIIMREFSKKDLTMRNRSLPISSTRFTVEMFLGQVVTGIIIYSAFLISLLIVFKGDTGGLPLWELIANGLAYTFAALGMSSLICAISTEKNFLYGISNSLPLGLAFISGTMVPLEFLSDGVMRLAGFFPMIYYNRNNINIDAGQPILNNILILVLFGLFYITAGITVSKLKNGESLLPVRRKEALTI